jgi:hypothetical protein
LILINILQSSHKNYNLAGLPFLPLLLPLKVPSTIYPDSITTEICDVIAQKGTSNPATESTITIIIITHG